MLKKSLLCQSMDTSKTSREAIRHEKGNEHFARGKIDTFVEAKHRQIWYQNVKR